MRQARSLGILPNFAEGDFVLVARSDFTAGKKISLCWRGPRRVIKALNDYIYQVEDLGNGIVKDVHSWRLKFYHDPFLNVEAIMSHVVSSENGMAVQCLLHLVDFDDGHMVLVRWAGLLPSEGTVKPLQKVQEGIPDPLQKLFCRKNASADIVDKARRELSL